MSKIFFSSIPKCGKNLLYSLFQGVGIKRYHPSTEEFAEAAYAMAFQGVNYAYPSKVSAFGPDKFEGFRRELVAMGNNSIFHRHLLPLPRFREDLREEHTRTFFIARDPRDALLSAANYLIAQGKPHHIREELSAKSYEDILLAFLRGDNGITPFLEQFNAFRDWTKWEEVCFVRFEDLVGRAGGGDEERQRETLATMLKHAKLDLDLVDLAAQSVFNPLSGTFFRGQIGGFRDYFNGKVHHEFEKRFGHLLDEWEYQ